MLVNTEEIESVFIKIEDLEKLISGEDNFYIYNSMYSDSSTNELRKYIKHYSKSLSDTILRKDPTLLILYELLTRSKLQDIKEELNIIKLRVMSSEKGYYKCNNCSWIGRKDEMTFAGLESLLLKCPTCNPF